MICVPERYADRAVPRALCDDPGTDVVRSLSELRLLHSGITDPPRCTVVLLLPGTFLEVLESATEYCHEQGRSWRMLDTPAL